MFVRVWCLSASILMATKVYGLSSSSLVHHCCGRVFSGPYKRKSNGGFVAGSAYWPNRLVSDTARARLSEQI